MALEEGRFFRGSMTDKRFEADGMAAVFRRFLPSGVWELGSNLQVTAEDGMAVNVGYGYALVDGYPYGVIDNGTGPLRLTLDAADAQPRIDRVAVKANALSLRVYAYVKRGVPSASPTAPALVAGEVSLARIAVAAGASEILAANITDERAIILPPERALMTDESGRITPSEVTAAELARLIGFYPEDYLLLAGGTMTGDLVRNGAAGTERYMQFKTSGSLRWKFGCSSATETGVNRAGSNLAAYFCDDNGQNQTLAFYASRETGKIYATPNSYEIWNAGTLLYSTGVWTPSIRGATTQGTPTYSSRGGSYTRIGNKVNVRGTLILSSRGGMAGDLIIGGLPFTAAGIGSGSASLFVGASVTPTGMHIDGGQNIGKIGVLGGLMTAANITDSFAMYSFSLEYPI